MEKLGNKVMNSLDWTVQAFVDGRISTETLLQPDGVESILKVLDAKAGWIQEDESKLLLRKALFNVERGRDVSLRQYTTRRLAQIEAALAAALVTMPTATWGTVLKEGARLSQQSEQTLLNTLAAWSSTTSFEGSTPWTWTRRKVSSRRPSNRWCTPLWRPAGISRVMRSKRKLMSSQTRKSPVPL